MGVVYNCFLWKVVRQNSTDVTSFCTMQFEKVERGLLQEAFQRVGENKKGLVLENAVNTESIQIIKNECSVASYVFSFPRINLSISITSKFTVFSRTDPFLFFPTLSANNTLSLSPKVFLQ